MTTLVIPDPAHVAADLLDPPTMEERPLPDMATWAWERLGVRLWSVQRAIGTSVQANRRTAVVSCHGIGKTFTEAVAILWWIDNHPLGQAKVLSTADNDAHVKELWAEVRQLHSSAGLPGRITLDSVWKVPVGGTEVEVARGRKPADTRPEGIQGLHARFVLILLEEADGVPAGLVRKLESSLTNENSRMLAVGNPYDPQSRFAEVCRPGTTWNVMKVRAADTPNFTGEAVDPVVREHLVSPLWVEEQRAELGEDSPIFRSMVEAEWPEEGEETLITAAMVKAACQHEVLGIERGHMALDVARYGRDHSALYAFRGGAIRLVATWSKQATTATAGRVGLAVDAAQGPPVVIDAVGLGAGVYDMLVERGYDCHEFNGGARPHDTKRFSDARSEAFWTLREELIRGELDLDPADLVLLSQLQMLRWSVTSGGRIQVESKDDLRKRVRGVRSPDRADAVSMLFAPAALAPQVPETSPAGTSQVTAGLMTRSW